MDQSSRVCKIQGHEHYPVFHICSLIECTSSTRWCCSECLQQGIHHHNQKSDSHIMKRKDFLLKLTNDYKQFMKQNLEKLKITQSKQSSLLEKIIKECQKLEKCLIDYMMQHEKKHKQKLNLTSDQDQARFQQYQTSLSDNNFEQLDDSKINELIKTNLKYVSNIGGYLSQPLEKIKQFLLEIESIIKNYQIIDVKKQKYIIQEIDKINSKTYYGSSISKNEQYLAWGTDENQLLKIYDLKFKLIVKEIQLNYGIFCCQFTQDSSQLYIGMDQGYIYGFNVQDDFKEIFMSKINDYKIQNIITIQNESLISLSSHGFIESFIIKTDIKSKKQIFQLPENSRNEGAIDYDYKDEILIGGFDLSMKLWNCRIQYIMINKQNAHETGISQIQFINNSQNILSLDNYGYIRKWKIDFLNKDFIKLQEFQGSNLIHNFYQVNQDQNLIFICEHFVEIVDLQGETLMLVKYPYACNILSHYQKLKIKQQQMQIFMSVDNQIILNIFKQDFMINQCWQQPKIENILKKNYKRFSFILINLYIKLPIKINKTFHDQQFQKKKLECCFGKFHNFFLQILKDQWKKRHTFHESSEKIQYIQLNLLQLF